MTAAPARRAFLRALAAATAAAGLAARQPARAVPDGGAAGATEGRVKAAFLFKFSAYVEWPASAFASADAPLQFGVMGADDMAEALAEFTSGRRVNERSVVVRKLRAGDPLAGLHLLFVARSQPLLAPPQPGLLLVTESEGALAHGSVINFVLEDRRVRFEVALDAAARRDLRVSSRMLAVASKVTGGGGGAP